MNLDFPLLLVIAVAVSGGLALADRLWLAPRRQRAIAAYRQQVSTADEKILAQLDKEPVAVEYGKSLFPVLAIVFVLRSFLFEPFQIPSGSMIPTLQVGDFILVNKFSYGIRLPVVDLKVVPLGDPQRGDVMVFKYPEDPRINYIKRVVGVPGDIVTYSFDKRLYINGEPVPEQWLGEEPGSLGRAQLFTEQLGEHSYQVRKENNRRMEPSREWLVPEGHYFMLGDNRDNSKDSRYWNDPHIAPEFMGMVPDSYIVGKASLIWLSWPSPKTGNLPNLSRAGLID
ncbi:signal peptidase I [Thiopseudomonas denitrificans]|uniref:Signal peptidase I n=1 Tax=Thiopseudomonas denitrificans TaxID=1501432 RepID=A0A4V3D5I2_9GAMM|nr:signal peptidase I [Thiopseudomonas denitrificans]TDQ40197.1 signal peptidase I [Thiopseudomonas denitrificans]